jgi:hypothetical protein
MDRVINAWMFAGALGIGMVLGLELGRWLGQRRLKASTPGTSLEGIGGLEGAVFALSGLLVAFTFYGAASRFDLRRQLIAQEANAIGTAWLRIDLLPADAQPSLRAVFRRYGDSRIAFYRLFPDLPGVRAEMTRNAQLQQAIWSQAVAASMRPGSPPQIAQLVLPAVNDMIDITTTRVMAARLHPPIAVYVLLGGTALLSSLLAGYQMGLKGSFSRLHLTIFVATMVITVLTILEIEYPRGGTQYLIGPYDQVLVDVRASMGR